MAKIRYSDEYICPKCGRHTALVCRTDGTYQAHCMICDVYYDVEIAKTTNADRIRAMSVEELAMLLEGCVCPKTPCPDIDRDTPTDKARCTRCWLDWLKEEVNDGSDNR